MFSLLDIHTPIESPDHTFETSVGKLLSELYVRLLSNIDDGRCAATLDKYMLAEMDSRVIYSIVDHILDMNCLSYIRDPELHQIMVHLMQWIDSMKPHESEFILGAMKECSKSICFFVHRVGNIPDCHDVNVGDLVAHFWKTQYHCKVIPRMCLNLERFKPS